MKKKKNTHIITKIIISLLFFVTVFIFSGICPAKTSQLNLHHIQRISRSVYLIQHEYYDASRVHPLKMLEEGLFEVAKEVPEFVPSFDKNTLDVQLGAESLHITLNEEKGLFGILFPVSQVFEFLHEHYKGNIKYEDMEYAFIAGITATLDPHSNILTPKIYEEFKTQTQGEYGGLGIVIGIRDKELTVIAPFEDTPAYRVGIKADDKILKINGQSTTNMSLDEAVDLMRGPSGTKVTLTIRSKNIDPREVVVIREIINVTSVQSKLITSQKQHFGVIRIKGFQDNTYKETVSAYKELKEKSKDPLKGLIIDLRNNAGGLLDQAILIADYFLSQGDIVFTVGANNLQEEKATAKQQRNDINLPLIVLTNEGTASASEIVAGAFKNNDRAIVMGQKSFGKGSVQSLFSLRDGSSLKLTVAQYLTPGRESIQAVGITPDIHLYPSIITDEYYDLHEDKNYSEDQLDAHLNNQKLIKKSESQYSLTYLETKSVNEDEMRNSYTSEIEEKDFPLQLAVKILNQAANTSKKTMLSTIAPLLKQEAIEQDKLIAKALETKKIDWSLGQKTNNPQLEIKHEFVDDKDNVLTQISSGTEVTLRVHITNKGTLTLHRVMTDVEAKNPLLNHKEFVFGKLNPGDTKSSEIKIKVPADIIAFSENITLATYTEKTATTPKKDLVATYFVPQQHPKFSYSYKILDGQIPNTTGNKNGIPEKGENVILRIMLKNTGPVNSKETILNIKNKEGKFVSLSKARDTLGLIKPDKLVTSDLKFMIKENFSKDKFEIDFFAIDDETKANITDTLTFNLTQPLKADPKEDVFQTAPSIIIGNQSKQIGKYFLLKASVTTPTKLKDISVFAKGKKILYLNVEKEAQIKQKDITEKIRLEDGINSIIIQARNSRDLMAQKSVSVVYNDPTTKNTTPHTP